MTEPNDIPEHVAQRLIARAIELESDGASRMPIARLREIADEAGISRDALQHALTEFLAHGKVPVAAPRWHAGFFRRLGRRLVEGRAEHVDDTTP